VLGGIIVAAFATAVGVFAIAGGANENQVARNVVLAGDNLGGQSTADARAAVDQLANRFSTIPVEVVVDDRRINTSAGALGLTFDSEDTYNAIISEGHEGSLPSRFIGWFQRLGTETDIPLSVSLDRTVAGAGLTEVAAAFESPAGYPTIEMSGEEIVGVEGEPGRALDVGQLLAQLEEQVPTSPDGVITIDAEVVDIAPSLNGEGLAAYVAELNTRTAEAFAIKAGQATAVLAQPTLRSWLRLEPPAQPGSGPLTSIDEAAAMDWLTTEFADLAPEIDLSLITVVDKVPVIEGVTSVRCCDATSPRRILDAIIAAERFASVDLLADDANPLEPVGIVELIGEFTTNHPAGQDRNINIDRMADIVRGAIVEPGDTFSINDYVGERTTDKGFVPAGVIYFGVLDEDVGGGVSQFATTLFNAAFFAGLDFVEYQAHSLYFSRYPYGREATVSFPAPDLEIRNTTQHPILIWTSHTAESITVELYGTAYATTTESGAWTEPVGACTKAVTERTRTYPDKDPIVDTVQALYQPQEGLDCAGLPTTPAPTCGPTEEAYDSNNTGFVDACRPRPAGSLSPSPSDRPGGLGVACTGGQQPADSNGDGIADICASPVTASTDPCSPLVGIDSDGNGFIDQCVQPGG